MREILLYFSVKYLGDWEKIYNAIENKEDVDFNLLNKITEEYKGKYFAIVDKEYPNKLKMIDRPPFVIFYKGNINLLFEKKIIWPINSIEVADKEIKKQTKEFETEGITTINGYSSTLEKKLLDNFSSKVIVVKDGGIDNSLVISEELENSILSKDNLIISEYPGHVIPTKGNWEESNRIKIGLSSSLLLLNSLKERELFMIIANTIHEGKEVYCLYDNNSKSHNSVLIEKGAYGINKLSEIKY